MPVWSYTAVPLQPATSGAVTAPIRGEISGEDPPSVRAQLRRAGMQVIDLRASREPVWKKLHTRSITAPLGRAVANRLRSRRIAIKAELYDAVATMVDAGLTLIDAVSSAGGDRGGLASLSKELTADLKDGRSLADAMSSRDSWFDQAEVAIIRAGEHRGELAAALRTLADRQHRAGELSGKLVAALAYPSIISIVGVGVVVFLSTQTLPQITEILVDAEVPVPSITAAVILVGQSLVAFGPLLLVNAPVIVLGLMLTAKISVIRDWFRHLRDCITPRLVRRAAVGDAITELAELARVGVPFTEALGVVAGTVKGFGVGPLQRRLKDAVAAIERGVPISEAFDDQRWFDQELRRLIATGESAGELPGILARVGERYRRSARRSIDRLAGFLEPAVILVLAVGIGLVVMAAIQPLVRLQEVL